MTDGAAAIKLAIELLHMPSRVRFERTQILPAGLPLLLRAAAGDEAAAAAAASVLDRPPRLVIESARFFIEQILLAPDADSYRVLGSSRTASAVELRQNMALLLRSLHPDVEHEGRSVFAQRITGAWDHLKTPERRAAYDRELGHVPREAPRQATKRPKLRRRIRRTGWRHAIAAAFGMAKS